MREYHLQKLALTILGVGQHAGISKAENRNTPKKQGWVNMQEWWVNINKNGGSTWSGIYIYFCDRGVMAAMSYADDGSA